MKQSSGTLEQRAARVLSPVLGHYTWLEVDHGEGSWLVTGREAVIVFRGGFHGRTVGAASVTTSKSLYRKGYGALLPEVHVAPYPYPLDCPITPAHDAETCGQHSLALIEQMLEHDVPAEHIAAILIE